MINLIKFICYIIRIKYSMLKISICLPWNMYLHGSCHERFNPKGHYINDILLDLDEFYNEGEELLFKFNSYYENHWIYEVGGYKRYIEPKIELVNVYEIENYSLCIPKTFALKIFQRKWKKYYRQKINFYKNIKNLRIRQLTGKFFKNNYLKKIRYSY